MRDSSSDSYRMRHPLVGDLTVTQQTLAFPQAPGRTVVICTAAADSASTQALDLLGRLVAPQSARIDPTRRSRKRPTADPSAVAHLRCGVSARRWAKTTCLIAGTASLAKRGKLRKPWGIAGYSTRRTGTSVASSASA